MDGNESHNSKKFESLQRLAESERGERNRIIPIGTAGGYVAKSRTRRVNHLTRVMSFTSGKGGVGKSNAVVNIGLALQKQGNSVLILDADLSLANIDILLGVTPRYTVADVLRGERAIEEILIEGPNGISILPAASGVESLCSLSVPQQMQLLQAVEELAYGFDYLLIDTRAGLHGDVLTFNGAATETVVVVKPEPTSLTDAYALMKVLVQRSGERSFLLLCNGVSSESQARGVYAKLSRSVERYLHAKVRYCGYIPEDTLLPECVRAQRAVLELHPSSPSGLAYAKVALQIDRDFDDFKVKGGVQLFFERLMTGGVESHG